MTTTHKFSGIQELESLLEEIREQARESLAFSESVSNPDTKSIFAGASEDFTEQASMLERFMQQTHSPEDLERLWHLLMDLRGNARVYARSDNPDPKIRAEMNSISERWMKQANALDQAFKAMKESKS